MFRDVVHREPLSQDDGWECPGGNHSQWWAIAFVSYLRIITSEYERSDQKEWARWCNVSNDKPYRRKHRTNNPGPFQGPFQNLTDDHRPKNPMYIDFRPTQPGSQLSSHRDQQLASHSSRHPSNKRSNENDHLQRSRD